jgi:predicted nucleic acid-binding protein
VSVVIADTGPIQYLLLIDQIALLPELFDRIFIPATLCSEMLDPKTPDVVRKWIAAHPPWLEILADPIPQIEDPTLEGLDSGERAALRLAIKLKADLVLMDDRAGVVAAKRKGLLVTGTLGILDLAAERKLVNIEVAIQRLMATNFRYPKQLIDLLLESHRRADQ